MADFNEIKRILQRIKELEDVVGLHNLQMRGLQSLTQSINDNVSAPKLFEMFNLFIRWDMQLSKFALLLHDEEGWQIATKLDVDETKFDEGDFMGVLSTLDHSKRRLQDTHHPFLSQFAYVIPVQHKSKVLAYLFLGPVPEGQDIFAKIQLVTTVTNVLVMAIENKRLFKKQMQQELLNREVEVAAEIQRALIPKRLPSSAEYDLSSIYKPHFAVGGDYYDVVEFPDGKIAFCIADITGKGVPAALLMANFQANFHALVPRRPTLEEIVREMNSAVFRVTEGDRFITLFLGKYDPETRTLHYINAGHTPPLLLSGEDTIRLKNGTTVLGFMPELPFLEIGGVCLTGPSLMFSYTDGLTDLRNREGKEFDEDLLLDFLHNHRNLSAKEINEQLLNHIEQFRQNEPYPDDITVLTCKLL